MFNNTVGVIMQVLFGYHASQRLEQRFGIRCNQGTEVDISTAFKKVRSYEHFTTHNMVEAWAGFDRSHPMLLIVDKVSRIVITVIHFDENTPEFYSELYRSAFADI